MEPNTSTTPQAVSKHDAIETLKNLETIKDGYSSCPPGPGRHELTVGLQDLLRIGGYAIEPAEETPDTLIAKLDDCIAEVKEEISKAEDSGPASRPATPAARPATPASPPRITLPLR